MAPRRNKIPATRLRWRYRLLTTALAALGGAPARPTPFAALSSSTMGLSEADTHAKLVNPALYARGWTEDHIKREETTGAVELIAGKARRRAKGRTDLTLR